MAEFHAGLAQVSITPNHLGFPLMGYGNRKSGSTGVHDPLYARALVLRRGEEAWALCSLDLCYVDADMVAAIRQRVAEETGLAPAAVLVATTHTHSGPNANDAGNWDRPFADIVAEGIVMAWQETQPARIAHGAGFLYGQSLNRRWFDRPIDPGVGVLRIDNTSGDPLGLVINFALHPVVMGYDNVQISADFVGYAINQVETELGVRCLFTNGGCADVNPLTATVRRQLQEGRYFTTMARDARFYGAGDKAIAIGDRGGGTFAEAEAIGHALAHEVLYVARGLETQTPQGAPWHVQAHANHIDEDSDAFEQASVNTNAFEQASMSKDASGQASMNNKFVETQALGIGDFALVAQPGEVFAESALAVKSHLRAVGYTYPWVVSYANDWQSYLTPGTAFPEGGYEVGRAQERNHSPQLPARLWQAIQPGVAAHAPQPAPDRE